MKQDLRYAVRQLRRVPVSRPLSSPRWRSESAGRRRFSASCTRFCSRRCRTRSRTSSCASINKNPTIRRAAPPVCPPRASRTLRDRAAIVRRHRRALDTKETWDSTSSTDGQSAAPPHPVRDERLFPYAPFGAVSRPWIPDWRRSWNPGDDAGARRAERRLMAHTVQQRYVSRWHHRSAERGTLRSRWRRASRLRGSDRRRRGRVAPAQPASDT